MKYEAIHDISHEKIVERVNEMVRDGWEPHGGISVCPEYSVNKEPTGNMLYSQALIRR